VRAYHACDGHLLLDKRELDVNEFGDVERAVVVSTRRHGCGQDDACGVDGLEDALEVALCDLLDQQRCQALGELFVHAEVVDLALRGTCCDSE